MSSYDVALRRLTDKQGNELSKILVMDSESLSTQMIANLQSRINNPLFKLSANDYKELCKNNVMKRMMAKVIKCDVKHLTKFCKYINVFIENIESSPKSIKNKMIAAKKLMRGSLSVLPDDMLEQIVNKYKTIFKIRYVLKDWIPLKKLDWEELSKNPNAIELLRANPTKIDWKQLSCNPNAIELLKENTKKIVWECLSSSQNPEVIELLKENPKQINWYRLSSNPNPCAIELLKTYPKEINWPRLSANPNSSAIELLKTNLEKINWNSLLQNPNPKAIELLKAYPHKIQHWYLLSQNPNTEAIDLLIDYPEEIHWDLLSKNPNVKAIELLKANPNKIDWKAISNNTNPEVIELIKDKINEENRMSQDDYENLEENEQINWYYLSSNPNTIELLRANIEKIHWGNLSGNTNRNAIELLRQKIYDENQMPEDELKNLNNSKKISWDLLSSNPNAIELLKANPNKINWRFLSSNPNPKVIEIMKNNINKLRWYWSSNPSIFDELLE
jgi:hypothetical protein